MAHADRMRDGLGRLTEQLGTSLMTLYVTAAGLRLPVGGIRGPEQTAESDQEDGRRQKRTRTLTLQTADRTVWHDLKSPKPGGTVVMQMEDGDELTYAIEAVEQLSESQAVLRLVRHAHAEYTRPKYRK